MRRPNVSLITGVVLVVFLFDQRAPRARVQRRQRRARRDHRVLQDRGPGRHQAVVWRGSRAATPARRAATRAAANAATLKAPGAVSMLSSRPSAGGITFGNSEGVAQRRVADRLRTADRSVRAGPADGEPDHGAARRAARRQQADPERANCPQTLLAGRRSRLGPDRRRASARATAGARGAGADRRGVRGRAGARDAGTASGSGMPPRGGAGRLRRRLRAPAASRRRSRSRCAAASPVPLGAREHQHRDAHQSQEVHSGDHQHQLSLA